MANPLDSNKITRRGFMQLTGGALSLAALAACAPGGAPAGAPADEATTERAEEALAAAEGIADIPRNRTFIAVRGEGGTTQFENWAHWNPFNPVESHQRAVGLMYEPLAFYSAFADEEIMWLAESYEYNDDYTELIIKVRPNIKWSDGVDFTAEDVTFTLNQCKELDSAIRWGRNVSQFMESAETIDPLTTKVKFIVPSPRFFWMMTYHFDIGLYMMPKHIFENEDIPTFTHLDIEKGWPVTTGPWRVVHASPQQKILDRADDWWGVEAGVGELPEVLRFINLPDQGEQQLVQTIIKNEIDFATGIQPSSWPTVLKGNPKATSWTGSESPYGYVDWWPHSLYVNNEKDPWSDKNVRWALSYYIDRDAIVDVAWSGGASETTPLPMPNYPPLIPYFEAAKPLLEKYNTLEFNVAKGDALLEAKGWTKNAEGMWMDETGEQVVLDMVSFFDFTSVGPVIVEFLQRAGIESSYAEPPGWFAGFSDGSYTGALFGHGGSCREPYETLALYASSSEEIPGGHAVNFSRWHNAAYDVLVDEAYLTPPTDTEKLLDIWVKAMEIWLPELPDIQLTQGFHRLPWTTEYWLGMPDENNPYTNSAQWHLTFPLVLHQVTAAQA